jgi:hypothetical protein
MHLIIVRRGHNEKFRFLLETFADREVRILWDRRQADRRSLHNTVARNRRSGERRRPVPGTWANLDFVVARADAEPPAS